MLALETLVTPPLFVTVVVWLPDDCKPSDLAEVFWTGGVAVRATWLTVRGGTGGGVGLRWALTSAADLVLRR